MAEPVARRIRQQASNEIKDKPATAKVACLVLFQSGTDDGPASAIDRQTVELVQELLEENLPEPVDTIDVWLDSPGGDPHAAYKLVLALREKCRTLRVVIPDYAKSAATLFALGCDEIFMGFAAELGPLDIQIEHPDREGVGVSGLDVAQALEFIGDYALDYAIAGGAKVLRFTGLPRSDVLREFLGFVAELLQPVVTKLDPNLIHRAQNQLRIAQDYAVKLLCERPNKNPGMSVTWAKTLVRHLVQNYPAHGFVISRDEAEKQLKLPILPAEGYQFWGQAKQRYRAFAKQLRPEGESDIDLFLASNLDTQTERIPAKGEENNGKETH